MLLYFVVLEILLSVNNVVVGWVDLFVEYNVCKIMFKVWVVDGVEE